MKCQADIDNPETETTEADIEDVHVTAPNVFAGAHTTGVKMLRDFFSS